MAIERIFYCEGPDCGDAEHGPHRARTATPPPYVPESFIETREHNPNGDLTHHFCGWGCLMKYAAAQPEPTVIPWDDALGR